MKTVYQTFTTWLDGTVTWSKPFETRYRAMKHMKAMREVALVHTCVLYKGPEQGGTGR